MQGLSPLYDGKNSEGIRHINNDVMKEYLGMVVICADLGILFALIIVLIIQIGHNNRIGNILIQKRGKKYQISRFIRGKK